MTASTPPAGGGHGSGPDPSMEDILASIRRILSEDDAEAPKAPTAPVEESHDDSDDIFALDSSMLVDEPAPPTQAPPAHAPIPAPATPPPVRVVAPPPVISPPPVMTPPPPRAAEPSPAAMHSPAPPTDSRDDTSMLLGAEAAAAASSSVGSLLRTLANERQQIGVYRGGPTIEDLVREEMRPLLKQWLDANLPPMVERLVRAEIERVVGRALS